MKQILLMITSTQMNVHLQVTLEGWSTTFEASNECFLHLLLLLKRFIISVNTYTNVTCKILSSHNKAI